jgi:RNA 2',3'-cyclic 3'-phosphodiesterase
VTRAFVAVRPPDDVLDTIHVDVPDARMTTREQRHVTLQFLGNRADVDAVVEALGGLDVRAGEVQLRGFGAFPSPKRARVVWIGVTSERDVFGELAAEVGRRLAPLGHEPEDRPFHAHLTLARLKVPRDVRPLPADEVFGRPWLVDEVVVYESRLKRSGAEYVPRAAIRLPGP